MNELSYVIDDFDELRELSDTIIDGDISINIDFTCFQCDCGKVNLFSEDKCSKCGQIIEKDSNVDLKVSLRREKFSKILEYIKSSDLRIKSMRRDINNGLIPKAYSEDFISFIQGAIDRISTLIEGNTFKNVTFSSDVMGTNEARKKIDEIELYISEVYSIYEEILKADFPYIWENPHKRLVKSIEGLLNCIKTIIVCITSDTAKEAIQSMKQAQQKLDVASEEIAFFSNILNIKEIDMNFDMVSKGNINNSVLLTMMFCGSSCNDVNTSLNDLQKGVYSYFKDFLKHPYEHYMSQYMTLFSLAPYKLMGMMSFCESKFFEKISVVINILEKANKTDSLLLKDFLSKYQKKFVYAMNKLQELSQEFAFVFSYNPNNGLIIKNALRWYKDLSEGIYRDITTILVGSAYIIDKKSIDEEYLLKYMGFPDKLNYLENKTKLRLDLLTDGVEKILRHSEAHVDYDILTNEEKVIARNLKYDKENKVGKIDEISYTFEEFLKIETTLAETIFSICAGLNIFIVNNYSEYSDFTNIVEQEIEQPMDKRILEYMLPFIGIVVDSMGSSIEEKNNVLQIKCTSIERTDRELLDKIIPCISPIVIHEPQIDLVRVDVFSTNQMFIGSVQVWTKYIKAFNKTDKKFQKYDMALLLKTSQIKSEMDDKRIITEDTFGFEFVFGMLKLSMPLVEQLRDLEVLLLKNIQANISYLSDIKEEFAYVNQTIREYSVNVSDIRLLNFVIGIINNFISATDKLIKFHGANTLFAVNEAYQVYKKGCLLIADVSATEGNSLKIEDLLKNNKSSVVHFNSVEKTGRNDPCTCGSGKKYKKCCGMN